MSRSEIIARLQENRAELSRRGVKSVAIFGSVARGEETEKSDVDVLVEFDPSFRIGLFAFIRLQDFLSDLVGRRVDLATPEALRAEMRPKILRELIYA